MPRCLDRYFDSDEHLYLRARQSIFPVDENLKGRIYQITPFPAFSVDREHRVDSVEDVLEPDWTGWGVLAFQVRDIPDPLMWSDGSGQDRRLYTFGVEHVPESRNCAHSEVRSYRRGKLERPTKPLRAEFRAILAHRLVPEKIPD